MKTRSIALCCALLATAAFAVPSMAADGTPVYLLFANTSSHPFQVKAMTLGGKTCPGCNDRTIAPGTVTMLKVGELGGDHLKMAITGGEGGTCNYDIAADGSSEHGDCGSKPKLAYTTGVHSDFMFDTAGTPVFDLFYAYDPPAGQ